MTTPTPEIPSITLDGKGWLHAAIFQMIAVPKTDRDSSLESDIIAAASCIELLRTAATGLLLEYALGKPKTENWETLLLILSGSEATQSLRILKRLADNRQPYDQPFDKLLLCILNLEEKSAEKTPLKFWEEIINEPTENVRVPATAFLGMLEQDWKKAIDNIPKLPNEEDIADVVAMSLDCAADKLDDETRRAMMLQSLDVAKTCKEMGKTHLSQGITTWTEEYTPTETPN